jgi:hypothetical protein
MLRKTFLCVSLLTAIGILASFNAHPDSFILPTPNLFDTAWDDRSLYQAGLIEGERVVLEELPGASIYHIDLRIAETLVDVEGKLEVRYTNQETEPLHEVLFHLYANLLGGRIDIQTASVNGRSVVPIHDLDESVLCLPLFEPLEPESQVVFSLSFSIVVPMEESPHYGLFIYDDEILALSQCLPIIAVYDTTGWHADLPPTYGDLTYADSSFYLVRMTAPADLTLVATGIAVNQQQTSNEQQVIFAAGPVREFYLVASPQYAVLSERVGKTVINSYAPPTYTDGAGIALTYAVEALQIYEEAFGPYPYTEFDIVGTSMQAWGMEYPCVVAIGLSLYGNATYNSPTGHSVDAFELTLAHEVAHQWFYNVVGNDQIHEPWLDEAVVQYATWSYFHSRYGDSGYQSFRAWLEGRWGRTGYAEIPIGMEVGTYTPLEYSSIVYARGPLFLEALAETMGEEAFRSFLKAYYQTHKWGLTSTAAFKTCAETHCSCNLTSLFEEWVVVP